MFRRLALAGSVSVLLAIAVGAGLNAFRYQEAHALTNCTTSTMALNAGEQQLLTLINSFRQQNGRGALAASPNLSRAAAWMSEDLTANGLWDHTDSLGRSPFTRVQQCGYGSSGAGENLARTSSAQSAFNLWAGSPGHTANMLNPAWTVVGIGQAGSIWTADFGALNDSTQAWDSGPPPPAATATPTRPGGSIPNPTNPPASPPSAIPTATPTQIAIMTPPPVIRRAMLQMISTE